MSGLEGRTVWHASPFAIAAPGIPEWNRAEAAWNVSRYADIVAVLRSGVFMPPVASGEIRRVSTRIGFQAPALVAAMDGVMVTQSGESHRASREAGMVLMPALMARWTRERLREEAEHLVDELLPGTTDVVRLLVEGLPNLVAGDWLGLAPSDVAWLVQSKTEIMALWRPLAPLRDYERLEKIAHEALEFLTTHPRTATRIELPISDPSARVALEFFLNAATTASTSGTIGGALMMLAAHLDLQEKLRSEPAHIADFVDEALRMAGGARRLSRRIAQRAIDIGGVEIPEGAGAILEIERAGHDPSVYPEPDAIDLERRKEATLAFGGGEHPCMGSRLARLEIGALLESLLARFVLHPAGEAVLRQNRDLRRFETLPLRLEPV